MVYKYFIMPVWPWLRGGRIAGVFGVFGNAAAWKGYLHSNPILCMRFGLRTVCLGACACCCVFCASLIALRFYDFIIVNYPPRCQLPSPISQPPTQLGTTSHFPRPGQAVPLRATVKMVIRANSKIWHCQNRKLNWAYGSGQTLSLLISPRGMQIMNWVWQLKWIRLMIHESFLRKSKSITYKI